VGEQAGRRLNDCLQRWPVSKRVNSSNAEADDATLIEPVELKAG
jgi:hypothetical protein